tara:strand:- start:53 stop:415 length:363 start_codon:yes stop_codon:yes gene_type:complete
MVARKEEFIVITTNIYNQQYQYFSEVFNDLDSALEYAKPYCLKPVQFSTGSEFEPSVAIEVREVSEDDDGDVIEETLIEHIDPFEKLGLSEADILEKANKEVRDQQDLWRLEMEADEARR